MGVSGSVGRVEEGQRIGEGGDVGGEERGLKNYFNQSADGTIELEKWLIHKVQN